MKKAHNRRSGLNVLFGPKFTKWKFKSNQLYYVTPYIPRLQMCKQAGQIYQGRLRKPNIILWDMFGGIGTDSIALSQYFNIITTEINPEVFNLLSQNVKSHGISNVQILRLNCLLLLNTVKPDIIYFDPPWGPNFSPHTDFDFREVMIDFLPKVENLNLPLLKIYMKVSSTDVLTYILNNITNNVIVKSPLNSNTFEQLFGSYVHHIYQYPRKNLKFLYLVGPDQ